MKLLSFALLLTSLASASPFSVVSEDAHGGATRLEASVQHGRVDLIVSSAQAKGKFSLTPAQWKELLRADAEHARSAQPGSVVVAHEGKRTLRLGWTADGGKPTGRFLEVDQPASTTQVQFFYTLKAATLRQTRALFDGVAEDLKRG